MVMRMKTLDDLDIGFGLGTIFGASAVLTGVVTATLVRDYKRIKSVTLARKRLFEEIERELELDEE